MNERQPVTINKFELKSFGKDLIVYSAGNGVLLLLHAISVFVIAKYLSIEGYGYWQLFILYATYVGILHLGFLDGILVRWAGKEIGQIDSEIKGALRFLVLEQLIVLIPLAVLVYFFIQSPFQWIGLMILVYAFIMNPATFFMFTTQALRQFKVLTVAIFGRGLLFLILVILLFTFGNFNYQPIIGSFLIGYLFLASALAFWFRRYLWGEISSISALFSYARDNMSIGFFVLAGNFVLILIQTMDRLLISPFFSIEQFALYAFASNIVIIAFTFVRSISDVLFPYLSAALPELRTRIYQVGRPAIIISWAAILAVYFPLARLIEIYLPQYAVSLPIIKLLLGTVGFIGLIQILHVTYYRAYRKQRQYFLWGITALAITVLLVLLAIKVLGTLESVAIAMLLSFVVWYIANELSLKAVTVGSKKEPWRSLLIMVCYFAAFWLSSFLTDWFVAQMLIYIGFFLLVTGLALRSEVADLVAVVNKRRESKRQKHI